jgi:nucleoid-associated protein YgaU
VRSKALGILSVAFSLVLGSQLAADTPQAAPPAGAPRTGPATVAPHWSRYKYPETIPEGAFYHIVEKGDTLWDLSRHY